MKHLKAFENFSVEEIEGTPVYSKKCVDCNCDCDKCDCGNCDCDECCKTCEVSERKKNTEGGLTAKQRKLPPALQAGILKRLGKKSPKADSDEKADKKDKKESKGLSAAQKRLPPALQAAILKRKK
jgi:hypothetical protein